MCTQRFRWKKTQNKSSLDLKTRDRLPISINFFKVDGFPTVTDNEGNNRAIYFLPMSLRWDIWTASELEDLDEGMHVIMVMNDVYGDVSGTRP